MTNWETLKLGDVLTLKRGYDLPKQDRAEGAVPIYSSSGLSGYHNEAKLDGPGVVTGRYGTLGEVFYIEEDYWPHNTTLYVKDFKGNHPKFIYYFLGTLGFNDKNDKTSVPGLNRNHLHDLMVSVPKDKETQRRIAEILSALDDKVELNRRMNQTLEQMVQALFKHYFVDGIDENNLPDGWIKGKIGDIYKTTSGGTPSRKMTEYYGEDIPWIKSKELKGSFILETEEKITYEGLKKSSAKILPIYSVVIAMYGATVGQIGITSKESACNQAICAVLPNEKFPFTFIYQFLRESKELLINKASGSAQQNISQQVIQDFDLIIPTQEVLKSYHKSCEEMFKKIEGNLKEIKTLTKTRDTLLPKLMSGEIDVMQAQKDYEQVLS